jgi:hypothetical protein
MTAIWQPLQGFERPKLAGCHLTVVTINSPVSAVRYNVRHLSMLTCQFQLGIKRNLA